MSEPVKCLGYDCGGKMDDANITRARLIEKRAAAFTQCMSTHDKEESARLWAEWQRLCKEIEKVKNETNQTEMAQGVD